MQQRIKEMLFRLKRHTTDINWVDIYLSEKTSMSIDSRKVSIRMGIPGLTVFASDSGDNWVRLLKAVEGKLRRQLRRNTKQTFQPELKSEIINLWKQ